MSEQEIREKIIGIIAEEMNVAREKLADETSFVSDLGADSLDQTELMLKFEDAFDFEIPEDEAQNIQTIGDAVKYITEFMSNK